MEGDVECHENGKEYAKMEAKIRMRGRRMQINETENKIDKQEDR